MNREKKEIKMMYLTTFVSTSTLFTNNRKAYFNPDFNPQIVFTQQPSMFVSNPDVGSVESKENPVLYIFSFKPNHDIESKVTIESDVGSVVGNKNIGDESLSSTEAGSAPSNSTHKDTDTDSVVSTQNESLSSTEAGSAPANSTHKDTDTASVVSTQNEPLSATKEDSSFVTFLPLARCGSPVTNRETDALNHNLHIQTRNTTPNSSPVTEQVIEIASKVSQSDFFDFSFDSPTANSHTVQEMVPFLMQNQNHLLKILYNFDSKFFTEIISELCTNSNWSSLSLKNKLSLLNIQDVRQSAINRCNQDWRDDDFAKFVLFELGYVRYMGFGRVVSNRFEVNVTPSINLMLNKLLRNIFLHKEYISLINSINSHQYIDIDQLDSVSCLGAYFASYAHSFSDICNSLLNSDFSFKGVLNVLHSLTRLLGFACIVCLFASMFQSILLSSFLSVFLYSPIFLIMMTFSHSLFFNIDIVSYYVRPIFTSQNDMGSSSLSIVLGNYKQNIKNMEN